MERNSSCPPLVPKVKFTFIFAINLLKNPYFNSLKDARRLISSVASYAHNAHIVNICAMIVSYHHIADEPPAMF